MFGGFGGQTEVIVAAKSDDWLVVESIARALAVGNAGEGTRESAAGLLGEGGAGAIVEGRHRGMLLCVVDEELGRLRGLWVRYSRAANLSGAKCAEAWKAHEEEALGVVDLARRLELGGRWCDVGSGGGFPGLVVGVLLDVELTLVEPRERRAAFLELALAELGVSGRVVRRRVGKDEINGRFDVVGSRATFPPSVWAGHAQGLVHAQGTALFHVKPGWVPPDPWVISGVQNPGEWSVVAARCST